MDRALMLIQGWGSLVRSHRQELSFQNFSMDFGSVLVGQHGGASPRNLREKTKPMREELQKLIDKALTHEMTPQEIWDQRVSFVFGQLMDSPKTITKGMVEARAIKTYGPRPEQGSNMAYVTEDPAVKPIIVKLHAQLSALPVVSENRVKALAFTNQAADAIRALPGKSFLDWEVEEALKAGTPQ